VTRLLSRLVVAVAVLAAGGSANALASPHTSGSRAVEVRAAAAPDSAYLPPAKHVFVVNIENKDYERTWGPGSEAPYLAKQLRRKGVLIANYYGTAHNSLGNYLAQISGQAPDPEIQADCQSFTDFTGEGTVPPGQYAGRGCVFPKETPTLVGQMDEAGLRWRGYMQDMGKSCRHPEVDSPDDTQQAEKGDQYATRHNPFMYFHSIIDRPTYCKRHVVDLRKLRSDLRRVSTTRNLTYITPDLCSDGHDEPCVDGRPGGLVSIDRWMRHWVPRILRSPAFQRNGILVITSDESDGPQSDASACCDEQPGPNSPMPGIVGMGGGKVGALVISRWTQRNSWSSTPYNHYSLLASLEDLFGLERIGFAAQDGLNRFGLDVYNDYRS
jgi:hypothetical protein